MQYQQQVTVDLVNMVYTAVAYLALAGAVWLLLRLVQACIWLPRHMRRQNDVQSMLQEKVDGYERYVLDCEAKEEEAAGNSTLSEAELKELEAKAKERRDCLDMLKKEVQRIRNGGDPYDFEHMLGEEEKQLLKDLEEEEEEEEGESQKQLGDMQETEKLIKDDEPKKDK